MKNREQVSGVRCQGIRRGISAFFLQPITCNLKPASRGFSLVEMIVAVGLFAVVMMISMSALLALLDANRKARALESVINNLNIALDGMVRAVRMGSVYRCGPGDVTVPENCEVNGDSSLSILKYGGDRLNTEHYWEYAFVNNRLYKTEGESGTSIPVTAPEIHIESMKFYVAGATPGDTLQPKAVVVIKGTAGASSNKTKTSFSIQATAVQRVLDL